MIPKKNRTSLSLRVRKKIMVKMCIRDSHMSYLYDMNYFQAIEEIQKRNYLIQMIERFKEPETEAIFCRIQEETMKYMNQRIKSRT